MNHGTQIVSRRWNIALPMIEVEQASALREAYVVVMERGNSGLTNEGLAISIRIQAYLCKEYNRVLLRGWKP